MCTICITEHTRFITRIWLPTRTNIAECCIAQLLGLLCAHPDRKGYVFDNYYVHPQLKYECETDKYRLCIILCGVTTRSPDDDRKVQTHILFAPHSSVVQWLCVRTTRTVRNMFYRAARVKQDDCGHLVLRPPFSRALWDMGHVQSGKYYGAALVSIYIAENSCVMGKRSGYRVIIGFRVILSPDQKHDAQYH